MRIIHRISFVSTPGKRRELAAMGIIVPARGVAIFDIDEEHESWPALKLWIPRHEAGDSTSTECSQQEIADAEWLNLGSAWYYGYPQPEDDNGFLHATYDLTDYCNECGVGCTQRASFRMRGEPKWGRRGILQLNWIFGEYFVTPAVWRLVFRPFGVDVRPVMNTKGIELKSVLQLVVTEEVGIATAGLKTEHSACSACGRSKYLQSGGRFPALTSVPAAPIVRTKQYFGGGASACRPVLVSQAIARELIVNKVLGVSLLPVAGRVGQGRVGQTPVHQP